MRRIRITVAVAAIVGAVVGGLMLFIGIQDNPQGEFIDTATGEIDIGYSLLIFFSWFLPTSLAVGIVFSVGWGVKSLIGKVIFNR